MKKYLLRNLLIDRADLVDKGANQEAFIELFKRDDSRDLMDRFAEIQKHYGPGPHPGTGTSQDIHGKGGGGGKNRTSQPTFTDVANWEAGITVRDNYDGPVWIVTDTFNDTVTRFSTSVGARNLVDRLTAEWALYADPGVPVPDNAFTYEQDLNKRSGGPDMDMEKKRPAFLDEDPKAKDKKKKGKRPLFSDKDRPTTNEDEETDEDEDKKKVEKSLMTTLEAVTKGLIATDVFVDDATATDLRDMLPAETLSSIEEVLKSAGSAEPVGEAGMSGPSAVSATDLEELVEYVEKLEADIVDLNKRLEEPADETDIAKAISNLPEDVAKALNAERDELEESRKSLAKANVEKADREYVTKMESLPGIVDSPDEFGPVLRQIAAHDADLAKAVEDVLTTASNRITKGDLFEEAGNVGRNQGGDALEKATGIAKSMVEATPELSLEEARSRVWESNPELYAEYRAEREAAKK